MTLFLYIVKTLDIIKLSDIMPITIYLWRSYGALNIIISNGTCVPNNYIKIRLEYYRLLLKLDFITILMISQLTN